MYKFLYTECTNEKATEFETKSLLYLFSMREDSKEIDTFIIDCFNDVTGANRTCDKLWDVQSKAIKSLNPTKIGESLITLYENYISDIKFEFYILFFPKLKDIYFIDSDKDVFGIENFHNKYISKIMEGLKSEYIRRNKIEAKIEDNENLMLNIESFIKKVNFVIASGSKSSYIRNIIALRKGFEKDDNFFDSIFNEIRDRQSSLKNTSIHGIEIQNANEVLKFNKHLNKAEIEMLIINRIIGVVIFKNKGIPIDFYPIINGKDIETIRDIIHECNSEISLMLFNNSDKSDFWKLFEKIYILVKNNSYKDINNIFDVVKSEKIIRKKVLNEMSAKYFIALIKEGVENENS